MNLSLVLSKPRNIKVAVSSSSGVAVHVCSFVHVRQLKIPFELVLRIPSLLLKAGFGTGIFFDQVCTRCLGLSRIIARWPTSSVLEVLNAHGDE